MIKAHLLLDRTISVYYHDNTYLELTMNKGPIFAHYLHGTIKLSITAQELIQITGQLQR
jgi:hypothetical protein